MNDTKNNPLVSVRVSTYNSSKYVLETLESVKAQTYQNIELIVSDDCSTDNTVEICRRWLKENKERFIKVHLITHPVNTGVPANINRALEKCKGDWIKGIAADDVLLPSCIDLFMSFIEKEPNARIVESNIDTYKDSFEVSSFIGTKSLKLHPIAKKSIDAMGQYHLLLKRCSINAPGVFMSRSLISEVGLFDERYRIEDWPMWLKITKNGNKIYHLNKSTVKYRMHSNSILRLNGENRLFSDFYKIQRPIIKNEILPNVSFIKKTNLNIIYITKLIFDKLGLNKNNVFLKIAFNLIILNFAPFKNSLRKNR